jgi:hypothetical protein
MSREAVADNSPGRKPGVNERYDPEPRQGRQTDRSSVANIFCRSLRWLRNVKTDLIPGLSPGATNCRASGLIECLRPGVSNSGVHFTTIAFASRSITLPIISARG